MVLATTWPIAFLENSLPHLYPSPNSLSKRLSRKKPDRADVSSWATGQQGKFHFWVFNAKRRLNVLIPEMDFIDMIEFD
jgi:hypothetical protein